MGSLVLPHLTAAVLFLATPLVLRRGFPSTAPFTRFLTTVIKSIKARRPRRKRYSAAMRGARPWWE